MKRYAFKMRIPTEHVAEYRRRHDEIWPDLVSALKEAGISDYSIFLDEETGWLFALMHIEDEAKLGDLAGKDVMRRWWDANRDIQFYDGPRPLSRPLREVFHLD